MIFIIGPFCTKLRIENGLNREGCFAKGNDQKQYLFRRFDGTGKTYRTSVCQYNS